MPAPTPPLLAIQCQPVRGGTAPLTLKPASLPAISPPVVTVTSRGPSAVAGSIARTAAIEVALTALVDVTAMPDPKLTTLCGVKCVPTPVSVTDALVPCAALGALKDKAAVAPATCAKLRNTAKVPSLIVKLGLPPTVGTVLPVANSFDPSPNSPTWRQVKGFAPVYL